MKWPWVSRRAYDDAVAEKVLAQGMVNQLFDHIESQRRELEQVPWLREQNGELLDHLKRTDRVGHRMAEIPREQKPPAEPMTRPLREYIRGLDSPAIQAAVQQKVLDMHIRDKLSWKQIEHDVLEAGDVQQ